jgi:putative DNA primase/helicase
VQTMADDGRRIVEALGGEWSPRGGMACCPAHADATPSLSIRPGKTRLLFHCFAGCPNDAVLKQLVRLRLSSRARGPETAMSAPTSNFRGAALRLWGDARPVHGTLAETYLRSRLIYTTEDTTNWPLRFHPRTPFGRKPHTIFAPALIAAVSDDTGLVAVQRIFLDRDGGLSRRIIPPKRGLGVPGTGAVRLGNPDAVLGFAEGLETALSAMHLFNIPCWATLGAARIGHIAIPTPVEKLVLFLDNDIAGRRAAQRAHEIYAGRFQIDPHYPKTGGHDWNDVLRNSPNPPLVR